MNDFANIYLNTLVPMVVELTKGTGRIFAGAERATNRTYASVRGR